MICDRYGLPLTTTSDRAAAYYVDGVDRMLAALHGADAAFEAAIAERAGVEHAVSVTSGTATKVAERVVVDAAEVSRAKADSAARRSADCRRSSSILRMSSRSAACFCMVMMARATSPISSFVAWA